MRKTIEKIWNGEITPVEFTKSSNPILLEKQEKMYDNIERFRDTIDEKQKGEFDRLVECVESYVSESAKNSFCDGFAIGTRLTSEAFIGSENIGVLK